MTKFHTIFEILRKKLYCNMVHFYGKYQPRLRKNVIQLCIAAFPLPNGASGAPVRSTENLQWTRPL